MKSAISRRHFLRSAGLCAAAASVGPLILPSRLFGSAAPGRKINIGMIGIGRQVKDQNLRPFLESNDCQVVAVCDVDAWRMDWGLNAVNTFYARQNGRDSWKGCRTYRDFRDLLANKDIDAVFIATPDHWHAPMAIAAFRAGKDVSLEKPVTRFIDEGRLISNMAKDMKRIFRVDSEFRSLTPMHRGAELVRNGFIGKVHVVRTGSPTEVFPDEPAIESRVPEGLDYDMWLGPAPLVPYMEKRVHAPRNLAKRPGWMRNLDYCDGMVTNWGTHLNDIGLWGANLERTGPVEIKASGKFHNDPVWNVLEKFDAHYRFANDIELFYQMGTPHVRFEGDGGWVQIDYGKETLKASSPEILNAVIPADGIRFPLRSEKLDFLEAVRTRGQTLEDAEVGHRVTSLCHLAHIAARVGGEDGVTLKWDPEKEVFLNHDEANKLTKRPPMRGPWSFEAL